MRKSKFLSVLTATTLALTLAVPTVMPLELTTGVVKAVEVTTTAPSQKIEGRCGDNAFYSYDEATRTLKISGTGALWNGIKFLHLGKVDKVVIGNGITVISTGAFAKMFVGRITIPKTVRTVEPYAFSSVVKVVVEGDMNNFQCGALGEEVLEVELKGSAETLGLALAKMQYRNYLSVTIPKDNNRVRIENGCIVSSDGKTVYYHISDSKKVTIPDTAVTIKSAAFYRQGIEEVKLGKNVKTIEPYAFEENPVSKLTTNSKLKKIGRCAFEKTYLKKVTLKSSVAMSPNAFNQSVILTSTKSLKSAKTVMTSATFKKNKINAGFAKLTGAKGYQVQIKKGGKTYKYFTTKTSIKVKAPKVFKKKYNVSFSYDINNYTSKIEGKPAYISVRPYKIVKKNKKSYGKWSEKIVLTKNMRERFYF
ncbi:leucine-rich repeat domain-containing protein [Eubacterium sp.]|uniref:leucine-rich repeat domain-containing protein n=1 Tax=Eubacterium sp. TaxID=142586 RepID=UPI0035201FFE